MASLAARRVRAATQYPDPGSLLSCGIQRRTVAVARNYAAPNRAEVERGMRAQGRGYVALVCADLTGWPTRQLVDGSQADVDIAAESVSVTPGDLQDSPCPVGVSSIVGERVGYGTATPKCRLSRRCRWPNNILTNNETSGRPSKPVGDQTAVTFDRRQVSLVAPPSLEPGAGLLDKASVVPRCDRERGSVGRRATRGTGGANS